MESKKKTLCITVMCTECHGKGTYTIYNAYDEGYEHEVTCEYCDGTGRTFKRIGTVNNVVLN